MNGGWVDGWMEEWMDGCVRRGVDGWMGGWMDGCVRRGVDGWMGGWTVEGMNGEIGGGWMDGRWTKEEHSPPTRHPTTAPPPRRCALLRGMRWPACLWPPGFCSTGHPESLVLPHSSPQGLGCLFCLCPGARSWCPCQERGEWPDHAYTQPHRQANEK